MAGTDISRRGIPLKKKLTNKDSQSQLQTVGTRLVGYEPYGHANIFCDNYIRMPKNRIKEPHPQNDYL